ncbi:hypothetical protein GCM10020219_074860 [Nonomuraea dietziae]
MGLLQHITEHYKKRRTIPTVGSGWKRAEKPAADRGTMRPALEGRLSRASMSNSRMTTLNRKLGPRRDTPTSRPVLTEKAGGVRRGCAAAMTLIREINENSDDRRNTARS